jgi:hypothetical protein
MASKQPPVQISPELSKDQMAAFLNQNFNSIADSLNTYVVSDGSNDRIILGKLPDGTYGLVISKEGYDVKSLFL